MLQLRAIKAIIHLTSMLQEVAEVEEEAVPEPVEAVELWKCPPLNLRLKYTARNGRQAT